MQVHEIKPTHKLKKRKRIGHGGKKGTYSGRGIKGQIARTGHRLAPRIRELLKKYPKLRGYRRKDLQEKTALVNVGSLQAHFETGEIINPGLLAQKKIIGTIKGRIPSVKILGDEDLTSAFTIEGCRVSKTAKEKIEKAGGRVV